MLNGFMLNAIMVSMYSGILWRFFAAIPDWEKRNAI